MKGRRIWSSIIAMFVGWLVTSVGVMVWSMVNMGRVSHDVLIMPFWIAYFCLFAWFLIALPVALLIPPRHFLLRRSVAPFFGAAAGFASMSWLLTDNGPLLFVILAAIVGAIAGEVHAWLSPEPAAPTTAKI